MVPLWHWKQTNAWYYTLPGTKKRMPLFDHNGERIRGPANQAAAERALAKVKVTLADDGDEALVQGEWHVARVCSDYLQYCERGVAKGTVSAGQMQDSPQLSAYRRVEDIEWGGIRAITLSADGNTLVACGSNEYSGPACALLFDVGTGALKRKLASTLKGFYYSAQFHPQGILLTSGGDVGKGEFRAWDTSKDESLATIATPGPCTAIDVHPDGRRCVVAQMNGKGSYPRLRNTHVV